MFLSINNVEVHPPLSGGVVFSKVRRYSQNSGYSASGLWSGDLISEKLSVSLSWGVLTSDEANKIIESCITDLFFPVTIVGYGNQGVTFTARLENDLSTAMIHNDGQTTLMNNLKVTLIER